MLSPSRFGGVTGDVEFTGEGTLECKVGGAGSWGTSVDVGYGSTNDLRDDFSGGSGWWQMVEKAAHQGQKIGWRWGCYLYSVSGGRTDLREGVVS